MTTTKKKRSLPSKVFIAVTPDGRLPEGVSRRKKDLDTPYLDSVGVYFLAERKNQ